VFDGEVAVDGRPVTPGHLAYLGSARDELALTTRTTARALLIGGEPFDERILMWWNFVARTPEEIATARTDWEEHRRFGEVRAYEGPRLDAPALTRMARPNPVS
jgi:redox-sensitive bicupin YhaK (pirin superfamily)